MNKRALLLITVLAPASLVAEPPELTTVRSSYEKQIQTVTAPITAKYVEFLENLKKQLGGAGDLDGAVAVQKELDALIKTQAEVAASSAGDKIVVWNQNNGGKGDRGTKKVNVSLFSEGREVWSQKYVKIDWDSAAMRSVEIPVPTMKADRLRVEITDSIDGKGGLSEVEYFRVGKNVALGGVVKVSATWENNPKHAGPALTDGVPSTFWLLPNNEDGWAEITLKP